MPLRENLWIDTLGQLEIDSPISVRPESTVTEAIALMQKHRSGCVLVQQADGRLAGIFTERDLLKRVLGKQLGRETPISTVMTSDPTTVRRDDLIGTVVQRMRDGGYRHLPVVDATGRLIGRVSVTEIVHYLVEHFPKAVYNLPPTPNQAPSVAEGA